MGKYWNEITSFKRVEKNFIKNDGNLSERSERLPGNFGDITVEIEGFPASTAPMIG